MTMRHRAAGFTLVEMLIALLILAIALTAAFRALGSASMSAAGLQSRQMGDWVAANRLAELRIIGAWPDIGKGEGLASQGGRLFHWREDIRATPNPLFRRVDISVNAEGDDHVLTRLSGFVARPLK